MTQHIRLILVLALIAITAVQCQSLRTRMNQIRVSRIRRLEEID